MGEAFITRRGGIGSEQALAPTITKVSETTTSITFTLKNNDALTATLVYRYSSLTGDGESISLATNTTSSNITVSSITFPGTLFVTANATGKVKSSVVEAEYLAPVFTAATGGTTLEYDSGGKRFKSHTFTSNGNFVVSTVGDNVDDRNKVDYLIIAGGAGGGNRTTAFASGGGGAGGYLTTFGSTSGDVTANAKVTLTAATFGVVVGSGGAINVNGNDSSVFNIISTGGGRGGSNETGANGGSGGGGSEGVNGGIGISGQGFAGGNGFDASTFAGGGGGGANQVGFTSNGSTKSNGGNGLANLLRTGSNETRAGGGGGAGTTSSIFGDGGTGGGGRGALANSDSAVAGTVNTGSGGGGGFSRSQDPSKPGGSGIVIIRYEIATSV